MGMTSVSGQRFRIDVRYPDDPHHIRVTTVDRDSRLRITSLRGSRDRYACVLPCRRPSCTYRHSPESNLHTEHRRNGPIGNADPHSAIRYDAVIPSLNVPPYRNPHTTSPSHPSTCTAERVRLRKQGTATARRNSPRCILHRICSRLSAIG